jgi:hypothetical protein
VLSSLPIYFLTVFPIKKWAFKKMDKIRRSFLWKGTGGCSGGHCLVRWDHVKRPKQVGGLVSLILSVLAELFGCVGYSLNGLSLTDRRLVLKFHVMRLTDNFFEVAQSLR